MQKTGKSLQLIKNLIVLLAFALIVASDQILKSWIRSYPEGHTIGTVGFIDITHIQNTGAAFGIFQNHSEILAVVAAVGFIVMLGFGRYALRHFPEYVNITNRIGFGLVLGGTIGNLIDRLRFGTVTDFIDPGFFAAFNIADSAITVGVILIAISLLIQMLREKQ
jgi:signal peptidase II